MKLYETGGPSSSSETNPLLPEGSSAVGLDSVSLLALFLGPVHPVSSPGRVGLDPSHLLFADGTGRRFALGAVDSRSWSVESLRVPPSSPVRV